MMRLKLCSRTVLGLAVALLVAGCGNESNAKSSSIVGSDAPVSTTSTTSNNGTTTGGASAKDIVPPDTSIVSGPSGLVNSKAASFTFTGKDDVKVAGYFCRLNAASWTSCVSPKTYNNLADGAYTFEVGAVDSSGNVDASPATRTWTVDTTPPNTSIVSSSSALTNSNTASFTFSSVGGSSFACQLDGSAFATCSSPKNYTGLADGSHTFSVRAVDAAGNTDASPATRTWTVDTLPPDTSVDSAPASWTNVNSASFMFSSADDVKVAGFACRLNTASWESCVSPKTYNYLADGTYTFEVRAIDAAGNTDASPATSSWAIDTTPPDTSFVSGASEPVSSTSNSFIFGCDQGVCTYQCAVQGGAFSGCSNPYAFVGQADGSYTLQVRATDAAGNTDSSPASRTWTVDTLPPVVTLTDGPASTTSATTFTDAHFVFGCNEVGCATWCSLDGVAAATCSSPMDVTELPTKLHTFAVTGTDLAGNATTSVTSQTWTIVPGKPIPDTGQSTCYNNASAITCPAVGQPFYGQDAQYSSNPMSFTDNGNSTVSDHVTGLMWEQKTTGNKATQYTWQQALNYCAALSLGLGGYSDWRLPDRFELRSIINLAMLPAIDTTFFPNTQSSYWSSSTYAYNTSYAWHVYFNGGSVYNLDKTDSSYVRCVRPPIAGAQAPHFADNGNGTVIDNRTGLIWQQQFDGTLRTWESALAYCEGLSLSGYTDWRLPDSKQLESIIDPGRYSPAIDTTFFPNTQSSNYWSSSTYADLTSFAWGVFFYDGNVVGNFNKTYDNYVRCVRP